MLRTGRARGRAVQSNEWIARTPNLFADASSVSGLLRLPRASDHARLPEVWLRPATWLARRSNDMPCDGWSADLG